MLEVAAEQAPDATFVQGDALELPFEDGAFERVFTSHFYGHLEEDDRERFLAEARRVAPELVIVGSRRCPARSLDALGGARPQRRLALAGLQARLHPDALARELGGRVLHESRYFVMVCSPYRRPGTATSRSRRGLADVLDVARGVEDSLSALPTADSPVRVLAARDPAPVGVPLARLAPARQPPLPRLRRGRLPARVAAGPRGPRAASARTSTARRPGSSRRAGAPAVARPRRADAPPLARARRGRVLRDLLLRLGHALLPGPGAVRPRRPRPDAARAGALLVLARVGAAAAAAGADRRRRRARDPPPARDARLGDCVGSSVRARRRDRRPAPAPLRRERLAERRPANRARLEAARRPRPGPARSGWSRRPAARLEQ